MKLPDRLARHDAALTPRERRVTAMLVEGYPHAGLEGATALAARAGISAATVVRLVAKLGYAGYPDLQRELRAEVEALLKSPLGRLDGVLAAEPAPVGALVERGFAAAERALAGTRERFDEATARAMADTLVRTAGRVIVIGEKKGRAVALYLHAQLPLPRIELLATDASLEADRLSDIGPADTVIAIDVRRYLARAVNAALFAESRGARLLVLADSGEAPLARRATLKLVAASEGAGPFDTYIGLMALADVLANLVVAADPAGARARLEAGEAASLALDIFTRAAGSSPRG